MRRGLCGSNAENSAAGPVPGAPRCWRVLFSPLGRLSFLFFGAVSPPISPPLAPGFPWTGPRKAPESVSISRRASDWRADAPGAPGDFFFFLNRQHPHLLFIFFLSLFSPFCILCREEKGARKGGVGGEKKFDF